MGRENARKSVSLYLRENEKEKKGGKNLSFFWVEI